MLLETAFGEQITSSAKRKYNFKQTDFPNNLKKHSFE